MSYAVTPDWKEQIDYDALLALREQQLETLIQINHWDAHCARLESYPFPDVSELTVTNGSSFSIRASSEREQELASQTEEMIRGLLPWRKGPFNVLGMEIDAEWRSDLKWDRFAELLPKLENKCIADVGCNNGYYLFRMLDQNPKLLMGLDPSSRCYYQFDFFQRLLQDERVQFEPFGIEHLDIFPELFHVVLCLGVIYHRRDPYTSCRMLFDCLKPGGELFFESLVIPGDEPHALCVPDRYAKMRNVWYIPTASCMEVWLSKAGFQEIEHICTSVVSFEEQRQTSLAPYESLKDFLDPNDPSKTVEGFPAPMRTLLRAMRPGTC